MNPRHPLRRLAGALASSRFLNKGRKLWQQNSKDWNYPLSKWDKLWCGGYVILQDFASGEFPPQFTDQAKAYQREIDYNSSIPGMDFAAVQESHATKPFWGPCGAQKYLGDFNRVFALLDEAGVKPPQRLLEVGCGPGWMAELLASAGYRVTGTSISPHDIVLADKKAEALRHKRPDAGLQFQACPMESVDEMPGFRGAFDAAYVYEALHHAYDWQKALQSVGATLKPGGTFLVAHEPNRAHTFVSYRVAKLSHTHEIGFRKKDLVMGLRAAGFEKIHVLQPRVDNLLTFFWIVATKGR